MPTFDALMFDITDEDYEPISTERDLQSFLLRQQTRNFFNDVVTCWTIYQFAVSSSGERVGQAFFNCLPDEMQDKLRGTRLDPFHSSDKTDVLKALDYLILSS